MLNSRQILDRKIITGEVAKENIAQVGIDLNVVKIEAIHGGGIIPLTGKTKIGAKSEVKKQPGKEIDIDGAVWVLNPGAYDVTFQQGCNIPSNVVMLMRQRSSLLRNGAILHSSVFDPGFSTEQMGTVLIVHAPMVIQVGARIAQAYIHECEEVAEGDLYNGQFQNDKQRKDV